MMLRHPGVRLAGKPARESSHWIRSNSQSLLDPLASAIFVFGTRPEIFNSEVRDGHRYE